MTVGLLTVELRIPASHSLKDKRRVLRSLLDRIRDKFNVAIAETADNDLWARSTVSVVTVANDVQHVNTVLNKVIQQFDGHPEAEVLRVDMEML